MWFVQGLGKLVLAVDWDHSSSTHGPLHKAAWVFSQHSDWLPEQVIQKNKAEVAMPLSLQNHSSPLLLYSTGHLEQSLIQ